MINSVGGFMITQEQRVIVAQLLSGEVTKKQFSAKRSAARRDNKLERSIFLAICFEVYKQEVKDGKKE